MRFLRARRHARLSPLACAALLAGVPPAWGQTRPVADELEPVTITGTRERAYRDVGAPGVGKTGSLLKETPYSLQTVTRELIEDRGVTTFGEAVRTVPGLTPQVGWGGTNDRFRLRGFATTANLKNGFRRSVFAPVDELVNVQSIEVLKGPASALYGRFEPGGVVNIVTRQPSNTPQHRVEATLGSERFLRTTVDSTGPISEVLSYRLTAAWQNNHSFRDFVEADSQFVSPVLRWQPSEGTSLTAELELGRKKSGFDRGFGNSARFLEVPIERNYAEPDARADNESWLASLRLNHRMDSGWELAAGLQLSSARTRALWYPYGFPAVTGENTANPTVNRRRQLSIDDQTDATLMAEVSRHVKAAGLAHRVLIGADVNHDEWDFTAQANVGGFGFPVNLPIALFNPVHGAVAGPLLPYDASRYRSRNLGVYAQDEIDLGARWKVLLGLRYDRATSFGRADYLPVDGELRREDDALSPRLGLTWTPSPLVSLYGSWSKSFLTEPFSGMLRSGALPAPSRGEQLEIGAKFSLLDGRLEPTVALFDIRRRHGVVSDPTDFNYVIQVGEQASRGLEIDVPYVISPRWRLLGSLTLMKAEISRDSDPALVGKLIANAPERAASLWSTVDLTGALRGWSAGLGLIHVGERQANTANSFVLPSYTRWDANLAYRFGAAQRYKLQATVQNLGDKRYYDSGGSFVPTYPGAPLSLLVSFSAAL